MIMCWRQFPLLEKSGRSRRYGLKYLFQNGQSQIDDCQTLGTEGDWINPGRWEIEKKGAKMAIIHKRKTTTKPVIIKG